MTKHVDNMKWFNPEVTLGHVLTMITIVVPAVVWGIRLEGRIDAQKEMAVLQQENNMLRVTQLSEDIKRNKEDHVKSLDNINKNLKTISDDVGEIKVSMESKVNR